VEKVLAVINFQSKKKNLRSNKKSQRTTSLSVAKKIIEWQQQGVPSDQFEELKKVI
jgi:hypothetical protein